MASQFERTWRYVLGQIVEIGPEAAKNCVRDAWSNIVRSQDSWSFLDTETVIATVAQIVAGTVAVTEDSTGVVPDATAKAALDAVGASALAGRQFRINESTTPIYNISSYDPAGAGLITLDRIYLEATNAAAGYIILKSIIPAPSINFSHWMSVFDPVESRNLRVFMSRAELDRYDPQRSTSNNPWAIFANTYGSDAIPRYEWYPSPTAKRGYTAVYRALDRTFDESTDLPRIIPEQLVRMGAMIEAGHWAEANRARHANLEATNWRLFREGYEKQYVNKLNEVQVRDGDLYQGNMLQNYVNDNELGFGAEYLQGHAPYGPS